ncbi:MAG: hypothetical protein IPM89_01570 [Candidatus Competibacteraceae bacterium]|nr:MAG: hypothetical protein IPM89_01570 [Candidatus Competibacteraceae bacterium]
MEWWRVGLALGLPWLVGVLWLRALWRDAPAGIWPMVLGYGGVMGLLAVTLLLRVQAAVGLPLNFAGPITVLALLALPGGWLAWRRVSFSNRRPMCEDRAPGAGAWWPRILFILLLCWLGWRLAGLAQEIWWRPLYPWDAWTTWTVRPRVWLEWHQLVPFVDPRRWLADTTGSVYTIHAWTYPYTVPLLALWPTLAYGAWNETAANLPWLGVVLALGLGFYGQARLWGVAPLTALIFTWLLLSLPLLDTHVALAGYADLWLATVFGLAVIAFFQWARDGDRRQGWLALLLALACPSIKLEGMVWLLLFLPALLAARLRGWWLLALMGVVLALGGVWWLTGGVEFSIPGLGEFRLTPELIQVPYLGRFALGYRGSWDPVVMNFLVLANWHLFAYLMLLAMGVAAVSMVRRGTARWQRAGLVFIVSSLLALFVLFFLTDAQLWAKQYTSINRVFLEFVPAFLFWMLMVFQSSSLVLDPPSLIGGEGGRLRGGEYPPV